MEVGKGFVQVEQLSFLEVLDFGLELGELLQVLGVDLLGEGEELLEVGDSVLEVGVGFV